MIYVLNLHKLLVISIEFSLTRLYLDLFTPY